MADYVLPGSAAPFQLPPGHTKVSDTDPLPTIGGVSPPGATSTKQTPVAESNTGAAAQITATLAGVANKRTYLSGFVVTGAGATGASTITVTVTGITGTTLNFKIVIPAGATAAVTPLVVPFNQPLAASADNTAIVVTVPSFGAGNLHAAVAAWGFQQ